VKNNKKKYIFNAFPSKKHFEKQPQLHFQTSISGQNSTQQIKP